MSTTLMSPTDAVTGARERMQHAKSAARTVGLLSTQRKSDMLNAVAARLEADTDRIVEANAADLQRGRDTGLSEALQDRLRLDPVTKKKKESNQKYKTK